MLGAMLSGLGYIARGTFNAYIRALHRRPMPTKIVTGLITGAAGDTIAQKAERRHHGRSSSNDHEKISKLRILAYATSTGFITAPVYHVAYGLLEKCPISTPLKVFIDIVCVTPIWYVLFMPAVTLVCRSQDLNLLSDPDCLARNVAAVRSTLVDNARRIATLTVTILAPAESFNFAFVPLPLRVPYLCLVDLVFVVGVSLISSRATDTRVESSPL